MKQFDFFLAETQINRFLAPGLKWQKNYEWKINYGIKQNVKQFFRLFQVE